MMKMRRINPMNEFDHMTEVVVWPDIQFYMDKVGFRKHTALINSDLGLEFYGSSAYRMDPDWKSKVDSGLILDNEIESDEFDELNIDYTFPE